MLYKFSIPTINMETNYLILTLIGVVSLAILFLRKRYRYWTDRGVYQFETTWLIGSVKPLMTGSKAFGEFALDWYKKIKQKGLKYAGDYLFVSPVFILVDPEIIKHILTTDFQSFHTHGLYIDEIADPLSGHLFNLDGAKWKNLRTKLTPCFTSGKMKMMFGMIKNCSTGLEEMLEAPSKCGEVVDIKDISGRFTTDVIGTCAFGIDCNSIKDPNNPFRLYGKKVFETGKKQLTKAIFLTMIPKSLTRALGLKFTPDDVERFFFNLMEDTVTYREKNNVIRKDFVHLLLQLKNKGKITDDDSFKNEDGQSHGFSMNEMTAQVFIFFLAGFETSSTTMTFALFELAVNQDIQTKVREEINETLAKYNGEVTYEAVMEMKYLDRVISETLRMHTAAAVLGRGCTKDYKIPGTNVTLEKGVKVQIPILGLHMDPEYYPDPEKFDPERFTEENKAKMTPFTYLPFGEGPRICIAMKFGLLQSKIGLISILRNYKVTLNEKTKIPLEMDPKTGINSVKGGVWVNVSSL